MGILIDRSSKVIVQGITGQMGSFFAKMMIQSNTKIVGGVSPFKGGEWALDGRVPVFETVRSAVEATEANISVIFVPPPNAAEAIFEAINEGISLVVCITSGIPVHDLVKVKMYLDGKDCRLIGPNSPGLCIPGELSVGILPHNRIIKGSIGVVSRSSTLAFQIMDYMSEMGCGVSSFIGIGDAPIFGTSIEDVLGMFEEDTETEKILLVGEQGGIQEENAAKYFSQHLTKPLVAYLAGQSELLDAYPLQAILPSQSGKTPIKDKIFALEKAGVKIATSSEEIPLLLE